MAPLRFARISLGSALALLLLVLAGSAWSSTVCAAEPASWPTPAAAADSVQLYVLSFTDQDIAAVAGQVLGVILQKPFDLDPAVRGPMSFQVEARLTRGQLLAAFERALAARGTVIVDRGGVLTLAPQAVATGAGARRRARGAPHGPAPDAAAAPAARPAPSVGASASAAAILAVLAAAGAALTMVLVRRPNVYAGGFARADRPTGRWRSREAVLSHLSQTMSIAPEILDLARLAAARSGCSVERILNEMGAVSDQALVAAYVAVTGCGVWRPEEQPALTDATGLGISCEGLNRSGLVPVALHGRRLTLAASDPLDDEGIARIAHETARTVTILVAAPGDVRRASQGAAAA